MRGRLRLGASEKAKCNDKKQQHLLTDRERAQLFLRACEILGVFVEDEAQRSARALRTDDSRESTNGLDTKARLWDDMQ
jgi:hypothetical protein